jgi:hypothetical protein
MVSFAVWPDFAAKIGELLGDFSEGLVELEIFAFDCEDSAEIRAPRQDVNVSIVAIKSPPEQTGQFDPATAYSEFTTANVQSRWERAIEASCRAI